MRRTEYFFRIAFTFVIFGPLVGVPLLMSMPAFVYAAWIVGGGSAIVAGCIFFICTQSLRNSNLGYWTRAKRGLQFSLLGAFSGLTSALILRTLAPFLTGMFYTLYMNVIFPAIFSVAAGSGCGYLMFLQLRRYSKMQQPHFK